MGRLPGAGRGGGRKWGHLVDPMGDSGEGLESRRVLEVSEWFEFRLGYVVWMWSHLGVAFG